MLFFICKDVLKSHLEALKIFLAAARYRYIKSIHFTNENDWYTSKKLSASDNKTQLKSLFKSSCQEFHWKGRFLRNSVVGILGKGRIGDGECWLQKRSTMWQLWVKFYLGQNEDYSLGDSISDSSEKQLQRGRQKISVTYDSSEVGTAKYTFWQRLTAHCKEQMSLLMILVLFLDMRRCKNWAHKIWKYLTIEADLFCHFPQNTECLLHSWSPPWTLCRGCWRSAAPEVHDLILVEVYGKCQSVVGRRENHIYVEDILNTLYKIYHLSSLLQSS